MLEGAVLTIGDEALRPGEIFALHRAELHLDKNLIHVKRQINLRMSKITWHFYDLEHRAIQWMVNPVEEGGLGLDPATVAEVVGHDDGGYLIATVYTKLGQRRAIARAQRAMDAYQQRHDAADADPPRLQVVRDAA